MVQHCVVLVAHSGAALRLVASSDTRVEQLQALAAPLAGVPVADQILMYNGAKLDPLKQLSAYRLPVADPSRLDEAPLFLYSKAYLRPGAPPPPQEVLPPITPAVPPAMSLHLPPNSTHPLANAANPAIRGLPACELAFAHHLAVANAYLETGTSRMQRCRSLLAAQEVQARAADAGRANVEVHYAYICTAFTTFMSKFNAQHTAHSQLLASFSDQLASLEAMALHPALQTERYRRLSDFSAAQRAREWADSCRRSHAHFAQKVSELEALFEALKLDVDGLFMQAPSVDLEGLEKEVEQGQGLLVELQSIVQVVERDLGRVRSLVEEAVVALPSNSQQPPAALLDACTALSNVSASHQQAALPRAVAAEAALSALEGRCVAAKTAMTQDVVDQLQRISAQQSKIRDMKAKLAAFTEVLTKQGHAFSELRAVSRLPAAYRGVLAECVRRRAWHELLAAQASKFAEHLVRARERESQVREAFVHQVERYIPLEILTRGGFLPAELPCPHVTVPPAPASLASIPVSELLRLPLPVPLGVPSTPQQQQQQLSQSQGQASEGTPRGSNTGGSAAGAVGSGTGSQAASAAAASAALTASMMAVAGLLHPPQERESTGVEAAAQAGGAGDGAQGGDVEGEDSGQNLSLEGVAGGQQQEDQGQDRGPAGRPAELPQPTSMAPLELENARLRADLATHIASMCLRELTGGAGSAGNSTGAGTGPGSGPPSTGAVSVAVSRPTSGNLTAVNVPRSQGGMPTTSSTASLGTSGAAAATAPPAPALGSSPSQAVPWHSVSSQQQGLSGSQHGRPGAGGRSQLGPTPVPESPAGSHSSSSTLGSSGVSRSAAGDTGAASTGASGVPADTAGTTPGQTLLATAPAEASAGEEAAVRALQRAVAAKEEYCGKLEREVLALSQRAERYESRITALEDLVRSYRQQLVDTQQQQQVQASQVLTQAAPSQQGPHASPHQPQQGALPTGRVGRSHSLGTSQAQGSGGGDVHQGAGFATEGAQTLHLSSMLGPTQAAGPSGLPPLPPGQLGPQLVGAAGPPTTAAAGAPPPPQLTGFLSSPAPPAPVGSQGAHQVEMHRTLLALHHHQHFNPLDASAQAPAAPATSAAGVPGSLGSSGAFQRGLLGPIALAAMQSRGQTPEPIQGGSTTPSNRSTGSSGGGGVTATLMAVTPIPAGPVVPLHPTGVPLRTPSPGPQTLSPQQASAHSHVGNPPAASWWTGMQQVLPQPLAQVQHSLQQQQPVAAHLSPWQAAGTALATMEASAGGQGPAVDTQQSATEGADETIVQSSSGVAAAAAGINSVAGPGIGSSAASSGMSLTMSDPPPRSSAGGTAVTALRVSQQALHASTGSAAQHAVEVEQHEDQAALAGVAATPPAPAAAAAGQVAGEAEGGQESLQAHQQADSREAVESEDANASSVWSQAAPPLSGDLESSGVVVTGGTPPASAAPHNGMGQLAGLGSAQQQASTSLGPPATSSLPLALSLPTSVVSLPRATPSPETLLLMDTREEQEEEMEEAEVSLPASQVVQQSPPSSQQSGSQASQSVVAEVGSGGEVEDEHSPAKQDWEQRKEGAGASAQAETASQGLSEAAPGDTEPLPRTAGPRTDESPPEGYQPAPATSAAVSAASTSAAGAGAVGPTVQGAEMVSPAGHNASVEGEQEAEGGRTHGASSGGDAEGAEDEDGDVEDAPDIEDIMHDAAEDLGSLHSHLYASPGSAGGAVLAAVGARPSAGGGGAGVSEPRTWLAVGSGLGESMLFGSSRDAGADADAGAGSVTVTQAPQPASVGAGSGVLAPQPGTGCVIHPREEPEVEGQMGASQMQGSMYASALGLSPQEE